MVFVDLSNSEQTNIDMEYGSRMASPADRLLAFFIDFLITSPIAGLFASSALRDLKENIIENGNTESILICGLEYLFIFFAVNVIMQILFLHFWNASPGQKVLNLKVIRFPNEYSYGPLSFAQCLMRSIGPWFSLLFLGIPMLEVFSHPWRRTFYDRLSDTLVVTLKKKGEKSPLPFEAHFIRQWMQATSFLLVGVGIFQFIQFLDLEKNNFSKTGSKQNSNCAAVNLFTNQKFTRLDRALSIYLVDKEEFSCVERELSNEHIYTKEPALAYFAKSLLEPDEDTKKEYENQTCVVAANSAECGWLKKSKKMKTAGSLSLQILQAKKLVDDEQWEQALQVLSPLLDEEMLFGGLQKNYIKAYFSYIKTNKQGQRSPASDTSNKYSEKFKEFYGVK